MAIVTPTGRPKSVRNCCLIEVFGGVYVLSRCFLGFSVGLGALLIGLSKISSFSLKNCDLCVIMLFGYLFHFIMSFTFIIVQFCMY